MSLEGRELRSPSGCSQVASLVMVGLLVICTDLQARVIRFGGIRSLSDITEGHGLSERPFEESL